MDVPEVSKTTTTTASTISTTGRIPHRDYLEAVHISRMIKMRMEDAADDEEQREELEKNLDQLITSPDKDTPLERLLGKPITLADPEDHDQEEEKVVRPLQALMEGPLSAATKAGRSSRKGRAVPVPGRHHLITKAIMRGLCPRLQDMHNEVATYRARFLDMTIQKLGWVGLCMGYAQGGPVWHIIKIQHDVTRDRLLRSIVMNAMGLSILAFGTRATNQEGIPADPNLIARDRRDPRAGILALAIYPKLNQRQLDVVRAKEALLGDGLMFEFVPPEWAENPFGEEDFDPFGLGESSSDSDSFIEEVAPPLPILGEDVLEEVRGKCQTV